jgi:TolB-like protein/DNA-binding SARP family transcriptional activator
VIRLRTLGALDLRGPDGKELDGVLVQPKRVALLCYLALATPRGPHRRDTLLPLFWPEHDADHARNSLSQSVHVLRRTLGPEAILSSGDTLSLAWGGLWCDAVSFEEALDAGRLTEAVDLYRGALLEGFHIASAPDFERWLESERDRLARRYAAAVEELASDREAAGDVKGAAVWWRRLVTRDPYSSRATLGLIRALAAAGDPAAAVQHARVHEALLREELNVAPDPEIAALVRRLESRPERAALHGHPNASLEDAAGASTPSPHSPAGVGYSPRARSTRLRRPIVIAAGVLTLVAVAAAITEETRASSMPTIRSIAVLPLENLSRDSTQQAFADGMHDALITELARYPDLSVISRTSMTQYKGTKKPLPEIARELKVDAVIEGTLQWERGTFRMNAQLVHASDRHVWAESYRRDLRDVLALQEELAQAIARQVRVASSPTSRRQRSTPGPADSVPRELYLKGLYLKGRRAELGRNPMALQTAKEMYRLAIQRDSTFALGYAGLAGVYGLIADYNYGPAHPHLDSARAMARRAVALDSMLPETRTALGVTLGDRGDFVGAEREFKRAIDLDASNAGAHYWYTMLLVTLGRAEEALQVAHRAAELDPVEPPRGLLALQRYAQYLLTGERPHLKLPVSQRRPILRREPLEPWARAREALEYAEEGNCEKAHTEILSAQRLVNDRSFWMQMHVAAVHWWCWERPRARGILEDMKMHPDAHDEGLRIASLHALFGEKDSAFVWLGRARWTMSRLSFLRASPWLDSLRSDPRFPELLERLGIRRRGGNQN